MVMSIVLIALNSASCMNDEYYSREKSKGGRGVEGSYTFLEKHPGHKFLNLSPYPASFSYFKLSFRNSGLEKTFKISSLDGNSAKLLN